MKLTCGLTFTLPLVLVLLLVVATKGHTVLQCYVCDNCEKVNKKLTPLEQCGGENFSTTTTTTTSTPMSTTEFKTSSSSTSTTTSIPSTVSTSSSSSSTEVPSTLNTTVEVITLPTSTLAPPTTPLINRNSTQFNASTSTVASIYVTPSTETSTVTSEPSILIPSSDNASFYESELSDFTDQGLNRQRRHTEFNGITYYCYKIQKKYDNVFGTKRGCIGVKTNERPVCDELDMANNNQTKKCSACTTTMCNGSSAMGASIATLLVVLLALIYKH